MRCPRGPGRSRLRRDRDGELDLGQVVRRRGDRRVVEVDLARRAGRGVAVPLDPLLDRAVGRPGLVVRAVVDRGGDEGRRLLLPGIRSPLSISCS